MKKADMVVSVKDLRKSYGNTLVLEGISFSVKAGTMLALLGPNGAGKTTTVRILSTLLPFNSGTVSVDGYNVASEPNLVRRSIGLTGQSASIDELLTGRENLEMMGRLYRLTKTSAKGRAEELLEDFDLVKAADRPAKTYSGGMRRRLDLAVSLIAAPPIIFLDEPTTGLDPRSRLAMWEIIQKLKASGTTILLTTQYLEEADQLADQIIVIDGGKVIAEGTAKQLKEKIGQDRLELTFASEVFLDNATKILKSRKPESNASELTVSVSLARPSQDVRRVLDELATADCDFVSMAIHKPTLDDVFMVLTGKQVKKSKVEKK